MAQLDGSAIRSTGDDAAQKAILRSLWLQRHRLFGAFVNARDLPHADDRVARQRALCTDLECLLTEAHNLLETLEALDSPAPGDQVQLGDPCS